MYRYFFVVSYDGTNYHGFQRQKEANTIQREIENAITRMTRQEVTIHSAGRTDKGVHAMNQTFHFDSKLEINEDKWIVGLNKRLPDDIIINDCRKVDSIFHSRHHAKARIYRYYIAKKPSDISTYRFELFVENFDVNLAQKATNKFVGIKDFSGFAKVSKDKDPIREIKSIEIIETDDHYIFEFTGVSFLRYMVRSIMGMIIEIATKKHQIDRIDLIFETKDRTLAPVTANAKGLFLEKIIY